MKVFQVFYAAADTIHACIECGEGKWNRPLNGQPTPLTLPLVLTSFTPALRFSRRRVERFVKAARPGSVFHGSRFLIVCLQVEGRPIAQVVKTLNVRDD